MTQSKTVVIVALSVFSAFFVTPSFANSTIDVLLQEGVALVINKSDGRRIALTLETSQRYHTDTGVRGAWTLEGDELCLVRDVSSNIDGRGGQQSCGTIPDGKVVGDQWIDMSVGEAGEKYSIVKSRE